VTALYVRRLQFEDVRCFRSLDFAFEQPNGTYPGWVVITGDNGSGKTALLRALSLCLVGPDVARALEGDLRPWIRLGASRARMGAQMAVDRDLDRFVDRGQTTREPFWAELEVGDASAPANGSAILAQPPRERRRAPGKRTAARGPWSAASSGWFCAGYGPYRRILGASQEAARLMALPGPVGRFVSMFREDAALSEAQLWAKDLEYRTLSQNDPQSERALEVVRSLLNDHFLPGGVTLERVDADGLWLADPEGVVLPVREAGDGRRSATALLTDIVRQMVDVYGVDGLLQIGPDGVPRITRPGVILIDEVDAHIHPEWQRHIGFWLMDHFPGVQFIVATHSPLVCQAASDQMIFHLPTPHSGADPHPLPPKDYWRVVRSTPDTILLSPAFQMARSRSDRSANARQEHARLQSKRSAGHLTPEEEGRLQMVLPFADDADDIGEK